MSRTFYVTVTHAFKEYTQSTMYEEVHADTVTVNVSGTLLFQLDSGFVVIAYAPGTWLAYNEDESTRETDEK